jgi:hypothetical protein
LSFWSGCPTGASVSEWMEVHRKEADVGGMQSIGFSPTEEDDWFPGYDPFRDLIDGEGEHVSDGTVKNVTVRSEDFRFILVQVEEVPLELFEAFLPLDDFLSPMTFAIAKSP